MDELLDYEDFTYIVNQMIDKGSEAGMKIRAIRCDYDVLGMARRYFSGTDVKVLTKSDLIDDNVSFDIDWERTDGN